MSFEKVVLQLHVRSFRRCLSWVVRAVVPVRTVHSLFLRVADRPDPPDRNSGVNCLYGQPHGCGNDDGRSSRWLQQGGEPGNSRK